VCVCVSRSLLSTLLPHTRTYKNDWTRIVFSKTSYWSWIGCHHFTHTRTHTQSWQKGLTGQLAAQIQGRTYVRYRPPREQGLQSKP
jgi:hypothetical protein